ncbi:MAG: glucose-6-phosphate isomerase [Candidatus Goldbacteria bacterium]|nr:glucose-6-phosphate isomerase [Candidatus Goldiibacteriota bacterium]
MKASKRIILNFNNMMKERLGKQGIDSNDIKRLNKKIKLAIKNIKQKREDGQLGFMYLPYDIKTRDEVKKVAELVRDKFENFIVLGIGGSALGTIALRNALKHPFYNMLPSEKRKAPRLFVMDNVDPEVAVGLFDIVDLKKSIVNIITKSGATAETVAFMKILWKGLIKKVGKNKLKDHIIITTDKEKGELRKIANTYGFVSFTVPGNVGGRFSVLSPVGILPLASIGVNIDELLKGAAYMDTLCSNDNIWKNPAYMRAILHYISDTKFGRKITVMMPYSNALKDIADWFAQLWAESLGKKYSITGETVHEGLTPVKALGATDQHSQVQLYIEGPYDKVITFLRVEKFRNDVLMPRNFDEFDSISYLSNKKMSQLLNAEQLATEMALAKNQRPSMTITLPEISEFTLGQLIYLLEVETAFIGELYNINAFDQPGVELGKILTYAFMGRKGYKDKIKQIKLSKGVKKYII